MEMRLISAAPLTGTITLPGDKSISHRAALLAALAPGRSVITNYNTGADCLSTLGCLRALGAGIVLEGTTVTLEGRGAAGFQLLSETSPDLDAGNSGSTMRMLAGILASKPLVCRITGDESLLRRPMRRIIEPLSLMGARIDAREGGLPPLTIRGNRLKGIEYSVPVASAQVKSAVLLAGLGASGRTTVREPALTRDHTERMLPVFGASLDGGEREVSIEGGQQLHAAHYNVPGDLSAATFFLVAALMLPGSEITIENTGLNPTRNALLPFLHSLGARIEVTGQSVRDNEPRGTIHARYSELRPADDARARIAGSLTAELIDEIPALAVLGTRIAGGLEIRDARELRVKESDRIRTVVDNLRAMGAVVEEYEDGLAIEGPRQLRGAAIVSADDHRIAMAFAVAALAAEGESTLDRPEAAAVSFPGFFQTLGQMTRRAEMTIS